MLDGEGLEIVGGFAETHEPDGKLEIAVDSHESSSLGGAVQFGHDEAAETELLVEDACLLDGVGTCRPIDHEP